MATSQTSATERYRKKAGIITKNFKLPKVFWLNDPPFLEGHSSHKAESRTPSEIVFRLCPCVIPPCEWPGLYSYSSVPPSKKHR